MYNCEPNTYLFLQPCQRFTGANVHILGWVLGLCSKHDENHERFAFVKIYSSVGYHVPKRHGEMGISDIGINN